jgi:hypothetical protein
MAGGQPVKDKNGRLIDEMPAPQTIVEDAYNAAFAMKQLAAN